MITPLIRTVWTRQGLLIGLSLALLLGLGLGLPAFARQAGQQTIEKIEADVLARLAEKGEADVLVLMQEQADTSGAQALATKSEKGWYVYNKLTEVAQRTQADLLASLRAWNVRHKSFWIYNMVEVVGNADVITAIAARPDVQRIVLNREIHLDAPIIGPPRDVERTSTIEWNVAFINADDVWTQLGVLGAGAVIGDLDTGVQWDHPALKPNYRGWDGVSADHNYNWWDAISHQLVPYDDHGHGTHTTGTAVGGDGPGPFPNDIGVAPGAKWMACKNMNSSGSGNTTTFTECFQFSLAPTDLNGQNPRPDLAPDVVNNSWGYFGGNNPVFRTIIQNLRNAGILVEVSAGNEGSGCATLRSPGDYDNVLTTGATSYRSETIWVSSSRGPSDLYPSIIKPDIVAPGQNINSSLPGNTYSGETWSGTSMAGPHVVGTVALIISYNPSFRGQVAQIEEVIRDTARPTAMTACGTSGVPNNVYGWGRVDAFNAVSSLPPPGGGRLVGRVTHANTGNPIPGVAVQARHQVTDTIVYNVGTNAGGYYTMTAMIEGMYTITATKFAYLTQVIPNVQIISGTTTTQDIQLQPAPAYAIWGTVTVAGTGQPVSATISFSGGPATIYTDPVTGYYTTTLPTGTYQMTVTPAGRCLGSETRTVTVPPAHEENFELLPRTDPFGYACDNDTVRPWITATTNTGITQDDQVVSLPIGFSFSFYGSNYTNVNVSSNGNLQFTTSSTGWSNVCPLPDSQMGRMIAPFWDDLYPPGGGGIYYSVTGSAPNRIFTVEWRNIEHYPGTASGVTFEVQLEETTNEIYVLYQDTSFGSGEDDGASASVGIQNGSIAFQYSCNEAVLYPTLNIHWFRPSQVTPTPTRTPTSTPTRTPTPTPTETPAPGNQYLYLPLILRGP